jgi:acyl dehydratase
MTTMAVTQDGLLALKIEGKEFSYTDNDTMLYALAIGMGADPMNRDELAFCYEKELKVMPSMATVIAFDDSLFWGCGLDVVKVVHGEQRLTMHRPLPVAATIVSDARVKAAYDKGEGRGALVVSETVLRDKASGEAYCTMESVVFARGDAVVQACTGYRPERVRSFAARFSAPVFPGDRLTTHIWEEDDGVHFTTSVPERDTVVLTNGFAVLAE